MIMVRCKSTARLLGFRLIFKADAVADDDADDDADADADDDDNADEDADTDAQVMTMNSYNDPGARKRTGRLVSD